MKPRLHFLTFVAAFILAACHFASAEPRQMRDRARLPIRFEPNVGQAESGVAFVARGKRYAMSLTSSGPRLVLERATLGVEFVGGKTDASLMPQQRLPGTVNYFLGSDAARWRTNVPTYRSVRAANVYDGIDVVYYGTDGMIEYDFVVAPGVDPGAIRLAFRNASRVAVAADGDLVMTVDDREVRQRRPFIYQDGPKGRRQISGHYVVDASGLVRFRIGRYDRTRPLVIDPVLVYSSYWGGVEEDFLGPIAVDVTGSAYLAGSVAPLGGVTGDAALTKIDPTGSFVVYTAYLGGSALDYALAIAIDQRGSAYLAGATRSTDFPTVRAFQPTYGGGVILAGDDGFVAKFNPQGTALEYSTYLGGNQNEEANAIVVTPAGEAIVAGATGSPNFPTVNALQPMMRGPGDMFVTRFAASGSQLVYSTFLGGSAGDYAFGVGVDGGGNVYVAGGSHSTDFPVVNPYQSELAGVFDIVLAKLTANGSALVYATYLGGSDRDFIEALAVSADGRAVVCGATVSADFPTVNAAQPNLNGLVDVFVTLFDPGGSTVAYSTFLGGSADEYCYDAALDAQGRAYLTGNTDSSDFPIVDAVQPDPGGSGDAFITAISPSGTIVQSTYLGGSGHDGAAGIALDKSGAIYVGGGTQSTDFPVTPTAFQRTPGGGSDGFVTKAGAICGRDVTGDLDIGSILSFKIPGTPWRFQLVLVYNHSAEPIGGPLSLVLTDLSNAAFASSPWTTSCVGGTASPFTIVTGGADGILSPGEIGGQLLLFYEPGTAPVSYVPRVLSGVPGR